MDIPMIGKMTKRNESGNAYLPDVPWKDIQNNDLDGLEKYHLATAILKLSDYEDAQERGDIIMKADLKRIINDVWLEHPYKITGNPESYSEYNEGWEVACNSIEERLHLVD